MNNNKKMKKKPNGSKPALTSRRKPLENGRVKKDLYTKKSKENQYY